MGTGPVVVEALVQDQRDVPDEARPGTKPGKTVVRFHTREEAASLGRDLENA